MGSGRRAAPHEQTALTGAVRAVGPVLPGLTLSCPVRRSSPSPTLFPPVGCCPPAPRCPPRPRVVPSVRVLSPGPSRSRRTCARTDRSLAELPSRKQRLRAEFRAQRRRRRSAIAGAHGVLQRESGGSAAQPAPGTGTGPGVGPCARVEE